VPAVEQPGRERQPGQSRQHGAPLRSADRLAQPPRAERDDPQRLHMEDHSRDADRGAIDGGEEQRPVEDHESARRHRGEPGAAMQPQLVAAAGRQAPQRQRQRTERAAAPHRGQRVLPGLLDEGADRAEQQAAADHQPLAVAFATRRLVAAGGRGGECAGGRHAGDPRRSAAPREANSSKG